MRNGGSVKLPMPSAAASACSLWPALFVAAMRSIARPNVIEGKNVLRAEIAPASSSTAAGRTPRGRRYRCSAVPLLLVWPSRSASSREKGRTALGVSVMRRDTSDMRICAQRSKGRLVTRAAGLRRPKRTASSGAHASREGMRPWPYHCGTGTAATLIAVGYCCFSSSSFSCSSFLREGDVRR